MKLKKNNKPRIFKPIVGHTYSIKDCGKLFLNNYEQVTIVSNNKNEFDLTKTEWGYYPMPSINYRLKKHKYKTALVQNKFDKKVFILLVQNEKKREFLKFLKDQKKKILYWIDEKYEIKKV